MTDMHASLDRIGQTLQSIRIDTDSRILTLTRERDEYKALADSYARDVSALKKEVDGWKVTSSIHAREASTRQAQYNVVSRALQAIQRLIEQAGVRESAYVVFGQTPVDAAIKEAKEALEWRPPPQ